MQAILSFVKDVIKLVWCKLPTRWGTPAQVNDGSQCSRMICTYCPHSPLAQGKQPNNAALGPPANG
jgi:hypothetical protein